MSASSFDCVKVAVRVRPFVPSELEKGCRQIVEKTSLSPSQQLVITGESYNKKEDFYTFDNVFMMNDGQAEIYEITVKPMIAKLFEGFNVTILAYGQTCSGKTFTMGTCFDGDWNESIGIIPRALLEIFAKVRDLKAEESSVIITCSFMELYCENLYDLLSGKEKESSICDIREDFNKGIFIKNLTEHEIKDESDAAKFLMEGGRNRTTGATAMNDASSRSHAIFTVNITIGHSTKAKFSLVDLAGSERSKKTKATGVRFAEGVKINEGLLALGNVISALGGGNSTGFVSYRDSKLTRLLQDSLGGNSLTLMIACVSPADYNIEETLSTLRYADRAKKIKNKPIKNQDPHQAELQSLHKIIEELKEKLMEFDGGDKTSVTCSGDCIKVKTELYDSHESLCQQLKNLSNSFKNLETLKTENENFLEKFIGKFKNFRDLVVKITSGILVPELVDMIKELDAMVVAKSLENSSENFVKISSDESCKLKMLEYTAKKLTAKKKIRKIDRAMKAKQKFLDLQAIPDESMMTYENKISSMETEIEELRALVANRNVNGSVANVDRKEKVSLLEKQLLELRRKCETLEKCKKNSLNDQNRVQNFKRELQEMKAAKLQLVKQQQAESKRFKAWIASRDQEIKNLTQNGRKLQNEIAKSSREHQKKQAAMKREIEKAKAVNKRLQEAIDRSKKVSSSKASPDDIREYVDCELMLMLSAIDAKTAMNSLVTQQEFLTDQMMKLRAIVSKTEDVKLEMMKIEEDLASCSEHIDELQEKMEATNVDEKLKMIPGTLNSADALKIALSHVMKILLELRENFTSAEMKVEDLQLASQFNKERIASMFDEMYSDKKQYERMKLGMENDFMMKLTMIAEATEDDSQNHPLNVTYTINCSDDSKNLEMSANRSKKRKSMSEITEESFNEDKLTSEEESFQLLKALQLDWNFITGPNHPEESKPRQLCFDED